MFDKEYEGKTRDDGGGHPVRVREKNHFYIKSSSNKK